MAFNCFGVSGWASGSLLAAALICLSSSTVGITTDGRLLGLDIMFHLATIGAAKADDPHFASINKGHVVQDASFRSERDHACLVVLEPVVDPYQSSLPIELNGQS